MKSLIILLLALCISSVTAFGSSGCYERMMFWYAYKLDPGTGLGREIGKKCNLDRACTFAEFMEYIAGSPQEKQWARTRLAGVNGDTVLADEGAEILQRSQISGKYLTYLVVGDIYHTPELFISVSEKIGQFTNGRTPQNERSLHESLIARKRIETFRVADRRRLFGNYLRNQYDPAHNKPANWRPRQIWRQGLIPENDELELRNGLRVPDCDLEAAERAIRANGHPEFQYRPAFRKWIREDPEKGRHKANIITINIAKRKMLNKRCKRPLKWD